MIDRHQPSELRILHWNIHSWRDDKGEPNLERVTELITNIGPDVVSLVEVDEEWADPSRLDELASRCGFASVFSPSFEFGWDKPVGGFGNAILTKLPILAVRQRQLVWPVPTYTRTEPSEPRSALFANVDTGIEPLWVGSTHLPRSNEQARLVALRRLISIAERLNGPWLMVGDFNTPAANWINEYKGLLAHPNSAAPTCPTANPAEAIDYCVVPAGLRTEAEVLPARGSDHLPLLARITLSAT